MSAKESKWRLTLTSNELLVAAKLVTGDPIPAELSDDWVKLRTKIRLLHFKVAEGITKPAFVAAPKLTEAEKLGLSKEELDVDTKRKQAYDWYIMNPESCTPNTKELALAYMYENDLMTPEQEAEYESSL